MGTGCTGSHSQDVGAESPQGQVLRASLGLQLRPSLLREDPTLGLWHGWPWTAEMDGSGGVTCTHSRGRGQRVPHRFPGVGQRERAGRWESGLENRGQGPWFLREDGAGLHALLCGNSARPS